MSNSRLEKYGWLKPLSPRDPKENHRVATSLELLFDLIFVIAIATAGQQLHHSIVENHLSHGLTLYFMVFFALWWAWMNFSWFASAYDNDDAFYRIVTFVQIIGSLVIAAGIPLAFQQQDFDVIIIGYLIMRVGLVTQWFRVAHNDPERKGTALRYAFGIILVQIGWLLFHFTPINFTIYLFLILVVAELFVPVFAEANNMTPWHPHHISERYALLTIIVLGEAIIGCFNAISDAINHQLLSTELIFLCIGGLLMMFTMWWAYFDHDVAEYLNSRKRAFIWGYGHFLIFVSIAALGAGLAAAVNVVTGQAEVSSQVVCYFIVFSLIVYASSLWLLQDIHHLSGIKRWLYPISAVIICTIPMWFEHIGYAIFAISIVYALRLVFSKCFLAR
ncbi:low temperature requirement protein A [Acinetobacter wuhouensis]|uniref:Low temperature requirement protein A n=1 Tax=Acinetobacter wuhouensis TaxID=1879050 RepID=A0A4Q7ACQ5_9GAMM|nr:low temperature requirement protein A [Acinetobacter wuhouensis]RZG43810.1 low temperature requirement protein A [Acinetobacter wuhouensis]RZG71090.1 low temperature requirement protein A [Acinetobacter wuhouensis]